MRSFVLLTLSAVVLGACSPATKGDVDGGQAPLISSFSASAPRVCDSTTPVTLTWTVSGATNLSLDHDGGDVTGLTQKSVTLSADTTFTLTASNAKGSTKKTVDIAYSGFPADLSVNGSLPDTQSTVANADATRLAFPNKTDVEVCDAHGCSLLKQPLSSYSLRVVVPAGAVFGNLGNYFAPDISSHGPIYQTELEGGLSSPVSVGASNEVPYVFSAQEGALGSAVLIDVASHYMSLAELSAGTWTETPQISVGGTFLSSTTTLVIATGYGADHTPWLMNLTGTNTLTLLRRAGATWSVATSKAVSLTGNTIHYYNGPQVTVSPDLATALVTWTEDVGSQATGYAAVVDMEHNTIGATQTVLPAVAINVTNFMTSGTYDASGTTAKVLFNSLDRAWTGTYSADAGTWSSFTPYRPDLVVKNAVVLRDACARPMISAQSSTTSAGTFSATVVPLP